MEQVERWVARSDQQMETIGKSLIVLGLTVAVLGLGLVLAPVIPFLGRLPGDFSLRAGGVSFFFPVATGIVISILLTIVLSIVFRFFRG